MTHTTHMNRFGFLVAVICSAGIAGILSPSAVHAAPASFYFTSTSREVAPGSEIEVAVGVDSESPLNAYHIAIGYPAELLGVLSLDRSGSVVDVWQSVPRVRTPGFIELTGGSTRAFSGKGGKVVAIRFRAERQGEANLTFQTLEAYIADGKGTRSDAAAVPFRVLIRKGAPHITAERNIDATPPEVTLAEVIKDPLNPNQNLLSFVVEDRETGVKETAARMKRWFLWGEWQQIENPVAIPKHIWAVELRTADNAGNLTAQVIYSWPAFIRSIVPVIAALVTLGFASLKFRKRKKMS